MVLRCTKHNFWPKLGFITFKTKLSYTFTFDAPEPSNHVNKLFGIGELSFSSVLWAIRNLKPIHHYNSIRWGWRYDQYTQEYILYWYRRHLGDLSYGQLWSVKKKAQLSIYKSGRHAILKVHDQTLWIERFDWPRVGLLLNPYFGGKTPTSKLIKINVD